MTKADQMDEELSLFLLSITMKGTSLKVSLMEEADRFNQTVKYSIVSGKIVNVMVSVSVTGQIMNHMKDISIWTNAMLLESIH